ncbi:THO complex subunit 6 [Capsicum annuum]|nr:THO complex subunit 6 [Capsicum annuum]
MATTMDCRNWNEDIYRNSIILERESQCRTVFRTAFAPNPDHNSYPDLIAAAISDGSIASYSISSCLGLSSVGNSLVLVAEPSWLVQGHDGPAYDVKFYGNHEDSLLLSCGDDGRIQGWKWKEMLGSKESAQDSISSELPGIVQLEPIVAKEISHSWVVTAGTKEMQAYSLCLYSDLGYGIVKEKLNINNKERNTRVWQDVLCIGGVSKPVLDLVNPQKKGPWGALSPIPENNCMAVNNQDKKRRGGEGRPRIKWGGLTPVNALEIGEKVAGMGCESVGGMDSYLKNDLDLVLGDYL